MAFTEQAASALAFQFWQQRSQSDWASVLPQYWEAGAQPHRRSMLAALRQLPRFETLREIGCCAGTNIRLIREQYPWVRMEGTEISVQAATFAQDKFRQDPLVQIVCNNMLEDAPTWPDKDVDVTMSVYSLAYVAPEDLDDLLYHMLRASAVGVLIVEPMHGDPGRLPVYYAAEWRHNYMEALKLTLARLGRKATLDIAVLSQPQEYCDGAAMVTFG